MIILFNSRSWIYWHTLTAKSKAGGVIRERVKSPRNHFPRKPGFCFSPQLERKRCWAAHRYRASAISYSRLAQLGLLTYSQTSERWGNYTHTQAKWGKKDLEIRLKNLPDQAGTVWWSIRSDIPLLQCFRVSSSTLACPVGVESAACTGSDARSRCAEFVCTRRRTLLFALKLPGNVATPFVTPCLIVCTLCHSHFNLTISFYYTSIKIVDVKQY